MTKIASGAGVALASRQGDEKCYYAPGRHGAPDGNSVVADVRDEVQGLCAVAKV